MISRKKLSFSTVQTLCTSSLRQMQRRGECGRRSMVEAVEVGGRRLRGCCYCCYSATTTSNIAGTLQPPSLPFAAWSSLQPSHQYYSHEGVVGEVGGMRGILMDKVAVGHQNFQEELILLQNLAKHQVCQEKYVPKSWNCKYHLCHST